jgi:hypothetical protein
MSRSLDTKASFSFGVATTPISVTVPSRNVAWTGVDEVASVP